MGINVTIVLGATSAGKALELLNRYHQSSSGGAGEAAGRRPRVWLAPTTRTAATIRERLARLEGACLGPGVTTFDGLSRTVIQAANQRIRALSSAMQRELLRRTVADATKNGQLIAYGTAAQQPGFIALLATHFTELRQRGIASSAYARVAQRGQSRQQELAHLFASYNALLNAHQLFDSAGGHAIATALLATGACAPFNQLDVLAVDGFTDFTTAELDLLQQLAGGAKQTIISLIVDTHAVSRDFFTKTSATLAELRRRFPKLEVVALPRHTATNTAIAYCADQVFCHPQPTPPAQVIQHLSTIEIVAASSEHDEITQIARRIKSLLVARATPTGMSTKTPVPADDVLVVFRSVGEVAARVEEVFARYGIPYSIETRPRLARSALYRTLRGLLHLATDDWPFRRLVAVVANRMLAGMDESARRAADWLIRDLQIASGRQKLMAAVTDLAAQHQRASELGEHQQRRAAAAALALPSLQQLADALDQLPHAATATAWVEALQVLCCSLGVSLGALPDESGAGAANLAAWNALANQLLSLERLDNWLKTPPRVRSRQEVAALLADVAAHEPLPRSHDEVGRVRVLSAQTARTESVRHLFLAGMSEQAFPAGVPSGRLASEDDYRFLANAAHQNNGGMPRTRDTASAASAHAHDEMLLFYEMITRAQETLTISYPAMDDKAQELPPSPYVVELQRIFRGSEQHIRVMKSQLSPVPRVAASLQDADCLGTVDGIYSVADWRINAAATAVTADRDCQLLAGLLTCDATKPLAQAIDAGLRVVHARAHGDSHGPYEGVLISPAITKRLRDRFGKRHTWSPSQFETYAACPYKFFLKTVLGLEPLGDLTLETDFARRGSLLHHVLAAFHRKFSESPSDWSAIWHDNERFTAELKRALGGAFAGTPPDGIEAALLELDRRQIDKWTDVYREQYEAYDNSWTKLDERPRPTHFELRFGRKHASEEGYEDPNSVDNSFQLDIGREIIHIAGRIDRIDVGRVGGQTVFNVIDYKSGKRPTLTAEKIESGERLQPALYVMAAQALVFRGDKATPLWAGYWSLKNGVTTRKGFSLHCSAEPGKISSDWEELQPKVIARIAEIVRSARRGDFPVNSADANCTNLCEFRTVCRIGHVRSVGKVWTPPASDA